jgi:hypothetical protein
VQLDPLDRTQLATQGMQPGRLDPIVVGDQDTHC